MDLSTIEREALTELDRLSTLEEVDRLYYRILGRKGGELTKILRNLGSLPPEEKKQIGHASNVLKSLLEEKFSDKRKQLGAKALSSKLQENLIDLTLPGRPLARGFSHPILQTIDEISDIFKQLGFDRLEGPDVETDFNNFSALNIPDNHPARDLHDTFYLTEHAKDAHGKDLGAYLLRTHTSPVQIRLMQKVKPPVRMIAPGRVYRHEAVDAMHAAIFHQIEGLAVDTHITFGDLKGTLIHFAKKFFGEEQKVRFRPSYFPFVEPGAEMDLECFVCHGRKKNDKGEPCGLCKASGWIEMLGAGMVHPQVFRNVGYDPKKYIGFAFGMGIERIVMTRLGIRDIRYFLDPDLRFLEQFR